VRLWLIIATAILAASGVEARVLPFGGHKADAAPKGTAAADLPICTTTTVVVKRGDVVLSTTSSTRCEAAKGQPPATAEAAPAGQAAAAAPQPAPAPRETFARAPIFSLGTAGLKPREVLGDWWVVEPGQHFACRVALSKEVSADGFRVLTYGCRGGLKAVVAWKFEETQVGLYGADGAAVAKLAGDKDHLSGPTDGGDVLRLTR
jgi:hypothetical protein